MRWRSLDLRRDLDEFVEDYSLCFVNRVEVLCGPQRGDADRQSRDRHEQAGRHRQAQVASENDANDLLREGGWSLFTDGRADAPTRGQGRHAGVQAAGEREREREIHTQTDIQTYRYTDRVIPCIGAYRR